MTPTHPREIMDLSLLQRGAEGTAVLGHSTPVSVEIRATRRVRVTSVQFALVHSLELSQMRGNQFGGTYHAAARSTRDIGSTLVTTDITLHEGESCFEVGQLMVPAEAIPTLHGKLARSGWSVRVRVSSEGNGDVVRSHPLIVQSDGTEADVDIDIHPTEGRQAATDLRVSELSTRSVHPGVDLSGVVTVSGSDARTLSISIVMQEEVVYRVGQRPQGEHRLENFLVEETVIDEVRLPAHAARGAVVPFTLTARTVSAPTVTSPVLRVRWFLRAALEVPFRRGREVTVPLAASTRIHARA